MTHPVTWGAGLGLLLGKPLGITACAVATAALMRAPLPGRFWQVVGVACVAGVGFTMSLFIGALAFKDPALATPVRLGVYGGSVLSAVFGLMLLARVLPAQLTPDQADDPDPTAPFIKAEPVFEARDQHD